MEIKQLEQILQEFGKLPKVIRSNPTMTELAGFPYYENVISNILSFFFDSTEVHGFKDLLIKSLLKCAKKEVEGKLETRFVERETTTETGKRIDLVIGTDEYLIGIENKIFAWVYNDLAEYAQYLEKRQQNEGGKIIRIVLSLRKVEDAASVKKLETNGFVSVNYPEFFEEIKRNIGFYLNHAHPEYLVHLKDLVKTIENLSANMNTDSPIFKFFAEHESEILKLMDVYQKESTHLANSITKLRGLVNEDFFQTLKHLKQRVYQSTWKKTTLYHDLVLLDEKIVSVEATLRFNGWFLNIFVRNIKKGEKQEVLLQKLTFRGYTFFQVKTQSKFFDKSEKKSKAM
ncbi:MAG: PD-(D/E)XK nuclease family protein [Saprospiraceae bacterium]|nr:PD-(D/E)XK nuclease family protein [Saprospiraceae bacterium]